MKRATLLIVLAACGGGGSGSGGGSDAAVQDAPAADAAVACDHSIGSAHARFVVISHPFGPNGDPTPAWEVLPVDGSGAVSRPSPPIAFTMGVESEGELAFTPDGKIGIAAQDDGSLGVFRLADDGTPTVVTSSFAGSGMFYASKVMIAPDGNHVLVLNQQTRDNGGGMFAASIGCDGTLTDDGMLVASKLPGGLAFVPGAAGQPPTRAFLAAGDVGSAGSPGATATGNDAELLSWTAADAGSDPFVAGVDAFGDDEAIVGGTAMTADGSAFAIGDIDQFSTGGEGSNRVAIVTRTGDALTAAGILPTDDPESLIAAPFAGTHTILSVSGFGNAFYILDDGGTAGAWRVRGQVAYQGAAPELPGGAVVLTSGPLAGTVYVAENQGVRTLTMTSTGEVTDHGRFTVGSGGDDDLVDLVGAIGVTP